MNWKTLFIKLITLILISFSAYSKPSLAQGPLCPTNEEMYQLAEHAIHSYPRAIGVSIAILHPVCGAFNIVFGEADIAKHSMINEDTRLPIASNTKPILLVLILKLMEEYPEHFPSGLQTKLTEIYDINQQPIFTTDGKVNLIDGSQVNLVDADFFKQRTGRSYDCSTDPIYQCPDLSIIDVHHLLIESSGLADYIRETDLSHDNVSENGKFLLSKLFSPLADPGSTEVESDLQALKKFGLVKKANPDPIIVMQSHNTDASLLAIILERVSGKSLNALLQEKIISPLNLPKDSMLFIVTNADASAPAARRYGLLNTDEEIDKAIAEGSLFPTIGEALADKFKPSFLVHVGRNLYQLNNNKQALDLLELHGQGIMAFPGPGGIVAQPKAYVRFYQALGRGRLLSKSSQALFEESFIPQTSNQDYTLSTGYESNDKTQWRTPKFPVFLSHGGFVPGGESLVMYNYDTGLTIMIATNFSGSWRNRAPFLFVTPTAYHGKEVIADLQLKYAELFNLF